MSYYEIETDDKRYPDRWFLDDPRTSDGEALEGWDFTFGRPYPGTPPSIVPIQQAGRPVAFNLASFDMPVVTERIALKIQRLAPSEVECFPVTVEGATGRYMILNVTTQVECVDENKSKVMKWTEEDERPDKIGQYRMIIGLTIDPALAEGHHIFRIKGWDVALIVSETVKRTIEDEDALGIVFQPVVR